MRHATRVILVLTMFAACGQRGFADHFTIRGRDGKVETIEARLLGSGQEMHALELASGSIRVVPQAAVVKREAAEGPEPLTPAELLNQLQDDFGTEFRGTVAGHFVIGLITDGELPRSAERKADSSLKQAARFMQGVERNFLSFAQRMRLPTTPPTHPLVLLIFETDSAFEVYHGKVTGGAGMAATTVAGFYSPLSNWLVIRMTECLTFETPLHEAIHQQVFNQHVLQRLAPTPAWFNEGIATGFEGNGDRISRGPARVSTRYSQLYPRARSINWNTLVNGDAAFRGNIFSGEAYVHAWCMHWLLVTKYKKEYTEYVRRLATKEPLAEDDPQTRTDDFQAALQKSVRELQSEFPRALTAALRRQRVKSEPEDPPGIITAQSNLADIKVEAAADLTGKLAARGTIRNISTVRPMTFHVAVIANNGQVVEWVVPNLGVGREQNLEPRAATARLADAPRGPIATFNVKVSVAAPESVKAREWTLGNTPLRRR